MDISCKERNIDSKKRHLIFKICELKKKKKNLKNIFVHQRHWMISCTNTMFRNKFMEKKHQRE
jgi:hypothetical protein